MTKIIVNNRYENVICRKCGKNFYVRKSKHRVYCSRKCIPKNGITKRCKIKIKCRVCGKVFTTNSGNQKTCCSCKEKIKLSKNKYRYNLQEKGKSVCKGCNIEKPLSEFPTRKRQYLWKDGITFTDGITYETRCKKCFNKYKLSQYHNNKPNISLASKKRYAKSLFRANFIWRKYKYSAKNRNLEYRITIKYIESIRNKPCYYCGDLPIRNGFWGIDRKDSNKGYVIKNCVPCCRLCNLGKLTQTYKEYIERCKKVYLHHKDKI